MLPRLRSFLKRSKSTGPNSPVSISTAAGTGTSTYTRVAEPVPILPSANISTKTADNSTPTIHIDDTSNSISTAHSAVDSKHELPKSTQANLLPSPQFNEAASFDTLHQTSIVNSLFATEDADTHLLSSSPPPSSLSQQSLPLPTPDCISNEKDIYIRDDELSKGSSDQLPWLSPLSKAPREEHRSSSSASLGSAPTNSSTPSLPLEDDFKIMQRKIWVRRPGASATLVTVNDDDLVDTVRDMILHKYANSLGKSIDSPDITLKIVSREQANQNVPLERVLGPDESIGRTLDLYYAGGQTIEEALLIDIPPRRTPRPSPRVGNHHPLAAYPYHFVDDQHRPTERDREYFPPMVGALQSPHLAQHPGPPNGTHLPHAMSIIGQAPPLSSPGGHSTRRRPKYVRQHTSSPTIMHSHQPNSNDLKQPGTNNLNAPAPLPTPPVQSEHRPSIAQPNRPSSPHSGRPKRKKQVQQQGAKTINGEPPAKPMAGLLDGNVPPINVLIVEDNVINLRLLEQFMRKLRVRWKTAMNGREAVDTWRTGGFHLVLMDIQLPVMSGLEATKEIRRLESVNGIGLGLVGGQNPRGKRNGDHEISAEDKLGDMSLFKSPVIIVALTASSLQSDRHEALAVGCNDFLTKPVGYPWMLRKVTEWGCMQALIDFDGWRKWKAYAEKEEQSMTPEQKKTKEKDERMKRKAELTKMFARPPPTSNPISSSTAEKPKETAKAKEGGKTETDLRSPTNGSNSSSVSNAVRAARTARPNSGSGMMLETHDEEEEIEDED